MRTHDRFCVACLLPVLIVAAGCASQLTPRMPTPEEVDAMVAPAVKGRWANGFVVALYFRGQKRVTGYGAFAKHRDPGTIVFEIGSATKPFTGTLLAQAVVEGRCGLEDPLSEHVPFHVPTFQGEPIRLFHLATHTSGLPDVPVGFDVRDPATSYKTYGVGDAAKALRTHVMLRRPGYGWAYSNLGMALCGWAVSRQMYKQTYERALIERVTKPLGLDDTRIRLTRDMRGRLAKGHGDDLKPAPYWEFDLFEGAGALRSTPADMLRWVEAQIHPEKTPIAKAIRLSQALHYNGGNMLSGLGWLQTVSDGDAVLDHGGQTAGFTSYVSVCPQQGYGVVVLSDTATPVCIATGLVLTDAMHGRPPAPARLPVAVDLPDDTLDGLVGNYRFKEGTLMIVTRKGKHLAMEVAGHQLDLYAESPDRLFLRRGRGLPAAFSVERDRSGAVDALVQYENGVPHRGRREP